MFPWEHTGVCMVQISYKIKLKFTIFRVAVNPPFVSVIYVVMLYACTLVKIVYFLHIRFIAYYFCVMMETFIGDTLTCMAEQV